VPFPTVVVCNGEFNDVDGSTAIEKILNFANLQCSNNDNCTKENYPMQAKLFPFIKDAMAIAFKDITSSHDVFEMMRSASKSMDRNASKVMNKLASSFLDGTLDFDEVFEATLNYLGQTHRDTTFFADVVLANLNMTSNDSCYNDLNYWAMTYRDFKASLVNKGDCIVNLQKAFIIGILANYVQNTHPIRNPGSLIMTYLNNKRKLFFNGRLSWKDNDIKLQRVREFTRAFNQSGIDLDLMKWLTKTFFNMSGEENDTVPMMEIPFLAGKWSQRSIFAPNNEYNTAESSTVSLGQAIREGQRHITLLNGKCIEHMEKWLNGLAENPPCPHLGQGICCLPSRAINSVASRRDWGQLMTLMSHSFLRGSKFNSQSLTQPFVVENSEPLLKAAYIHHRYGDVHAAIPHCLMNDGSKGSKLTLKGQLQLKECKTEFKPIFTDNGICLAFNALDTLKASSFKQAMRFAFNDTGFSSVRDLKMGVKGHKNKGLTFSLLKRGSKMYRNKNVVNYRMAMLNPHTSFDFQSQVDNVEYGRHTTIVMRAKSIDAQRELKGIDPGRRGCLFHDERREEMSIFDEYSQEGCQLEESLERAAQKCNCTPWDFTTTRGNDQADFCDFIGYFCFEQVLKYHEEDAARKKCLPNCDTLSYEVSSVTSKPIDVSVLCSHKWASKFSHMRRVQTSSPAIRQFLQAVNKYEDHAAMELPLERCREQMEEMALVTVQMSASGYIKSARKLRIGFTDKLAAFGKF